MTDSGQTIPSAADTVMSVIRHRRSVRGLDPERDIPEAWVTALLEAAIWAPSAGNRQPWRFIAIGDRGVIRDLGEASGGQVMFSAAPLVIAVVALPERSAERYGDRGRRLYSIQDTAAAVQNMLLLADALGLGATWVGAFDDDRVAGILKTSAEEVPVALLPMGFPLADPAPTPRRTLDEVVSYLR